MRLPYLLPLTLAACSPAPSDNATATNVAQPAEPAPVEPADKGSNQALPPLEAPAPGTPAGLANDMTPVSEAPFTPDSAQGAADVVQRYYALIEEAKYRQAWALWEDGGKASGTTPDAFAAGFARYSEYHANVGAPGEVDPGAGQRFVTVPVVVFGRTRVDGKRFDLKGEVTLHRTVVDGANRRAAEVAHPRRRSRPEPLTRPPRRDRARHGALHHDDHRRTRRHRRTRSRQQCGLGQVDPGRGGGALDRDRPGRASRRLCLVVTRHEIEYRGNVSEGDTVTAETWVSDPPRGARFDRHMRFTGADGRPRVEARTTWALIERASGRLMRVPAEVAAPFLAL